MSMEQYGITLTEAGKVHQAWFDEPEAALAFWRTVQFAANNDPDYLQTGWLCKRAHPESDIYELIGIEELIDAAATEQVTDEDYPEAVA